MLKGAELCWPITVKEFYAIVWAFNHFAIYLRGVNSVVLPIIKL